MEGQDQLNRREKGNRDQDRPSSDLIAELKQLHKQLEAIAGQYINPARLADAGFGGTGVYHGPGDAETINRNVDEASGRAEIEQRISQLETILRERGHL